ncbi:MAG: STAS domain-containing protein [Planctomycetes bacterium]|nr:STAS domain-containing protein [Planctomycetota bacterium]
MAFTYQVEDVANRNIAVLRVQGELDFNDRGEFQNAIDFLFRNERPKLVIDLTRIQRIASVFIGTLVDVGMRAKKDGTPISVMMIKRLAKVCREAGLDKAMTIIEVME